MGFAGFYIEESFEHDCTIKFFSGQPDRMLEVSCNFNQEFVDEIKDKIPRGHRFWDGENKIWLVHSHYRETVKNIALNYFRNVEVVKG